MEMKPYTKGKKTGEEGRAPYICQTLQQLYTTL